MIPGALTVDAVSYVIIIVRGSLRMYEWQARAPDNGRMLLRRGRWKAKAQVVHDVWVRYLSSPRNLKNVPVDGTLST